MQAAIAKINAEMTSNANNSYIQVIGQFLLQHLEGNPNGAEKLVDPAKTIGKSLDAMKTAASSKKTGNFAMLTPAEGYGIVLKYFGIESQAAATYTPTPIIPTAPVVTPKPAASFDVNLDEFL